MWRKEIFSRESLGLSFGNWWVAPPPPWPVTVPKSCPRSCPHRLASYQLPHTLPHNAKAGQLLESPGLLPFSLGLSYLFAATPIFCPFALPRRGSRVQIPFPAPSFPTSCGLPARGSSCVVTVPI